MGTITMANGLTGGFWRPLVGLLFGLIISLLTYIWTDTNKKIESQATDIANAAVLAREVDRKVAVLEETKQNDVSARAEINRRLVRIEDKLDDAIAAKKKSKW